jgi:FtsH-binding integral membrane protein
MGTRKRIFTGFNFTAIGIFVLSIFLPPLLELFMTINPIIRWGITTLGVLVGIAFIVIGQYSIKKKEQSAHDDSLILLTLLDNCKCQEKIHPL